MEQWAVASATYDDWYPTSAANRSGDELGTTVIYFFRLTNVRFVAVLMCTCVTLLVVCEAFQDKDVFTLWSLWVISNMNVNSLGRKIRSREKTGIELCNVNIAKLSLP